MVISGFESGAASYWRVERTCRFRLSTRWDTSAICPGRSKFPWWLFPLMIGKTRSLQMVRAFPGFDTSRLLYLGVSQRPSFLSPPTKCGGFADADHGRVQCNPLRHDLSYMSVYPRGSLAKENAQNGPRTKVNAPSQNLHQSIELIKWIKLSLHQFHILYFWSSGGDKSW